MNKSDFQVKQFRQKYPDYNTRHHPRQHNKSHRRGLIILGAIIFILLLSPNPQINAQAADTEPPAVPGGLTAAVISSSQINLSWTASTDNVGVTGYNIYRCAGSACAPTTQIATSATNSYSNTGLTASIAYTYAVSAYDAAGNESAQSQAVSATTQIQLGNTYYVDDDAPDDTGNGSVTNPKKYITSALQLMKGGDTLIIKDGVYTGQNNMIGDYASPQVWPPSGLGPSQYTVIKAENVGGAIIDGEYNSRPFYSLRYKINYLQIEGIHFRRGNCGVFGLKGDYNKILKSGFEDGLSPTNNDECPACQAKLLGKLT